MKDLIKELTWRGLLKDISNIDKIKKWSKEKGSLYLGFDPSFKSLHLGNYQSLLVLKRASLCGHKAYGLVGSITGLIGDPRDPKLSSNVVLERQLKEKKEIEENVKSIRKQLVQYSNATKVFSNIEFYKDMKLWDYLRDIGKLINVNYLLEKDVIARRLETGISYAEFSYTLLQGYDFLHLYKKHKIICQTGGSDQWGNITTGLEFIRKTVGIENDACCFSIELLLKTDGTKFGKSESGAIYLDPSITSPYKMYQFFINQPDSMVELLLKRFTFLNEKQIQNIMSEHNSALYKRIGQNKIAEIVTSDIHGKAEMNKCKKISEALFSGKIDELSSNELLNALETVSTIKYVENLSIIEALKMLDVIKSNSEGRKLIEQGSISLNNQKIIDINKKIEKTDFIDNKYCYLKKGKKDYYLIKY